MLDAFAVPEIVDAIGGGNVQYGVVVTHSCELDKPDAAYASVATAWRASALREQFSTDDMSNMLANKVLSKVAIAADLLAPEEQLIIDLGHMTTWSLKWISDRVKWSLDDDGTLLLQSALIRSFSLRDITREKTVKRYKGRIIKEVRTVKDGSDDTRVEMTLDDDDTLIFWLHQKKR